MNQKMDQYCAQKDERSDLKWAYSEGLKIDGKIALSRAYSEGLKDGTMPFKRLRKWPIVKR